MLDRIFNHEVAQHHATSAEGNRILKDRKKKLGNLKTED